MKKKSEKTEENKKDRKTGEMIISKKNKECSTSSHLRQGFYTLFLESIVQNYDAYRSLYCLSNNYIFSSKKHTRFQIHQKVKFLTPKELAETLSLKDLICYTCYVCCLKKKSGKNGGKQKRQKNGRNDFFQKK